MKYIIMFILIPTFIFATYIVDDGVNIRDYGSITNYAKAMQQVDKTNSKMIRQYEQLGTLQKNIITIQSNVIVEQKKQISIMKKSFFYTLGIGILYILSFSLGYFSSK